MTYGCGCNARIVEVKSGKRCETYEITESGTYLFKGDISFEPAAGGPDVCCVPPEPFTCGYVCPVGTVCGPSDDTSVVAIRIAASNVILDLAGFELSQGNNAQNVRGIQIERGLSNITVRNGIVRGFSQYGVRARGNTKDVEFHDLKVTKCGFNNVEVYRIFQAAMGGMALGESTYFDLGDHNLVLENVYMKNVKVVDNYFMGLILARSKNVNVQSSNFDDTYRNIAGLLTTNSDRIARYAYPLYLLGGGYDPDYMAEFVTFKNCSFNSARNDTPSSPAEANLELTGARCEVSNGHDIYFEDCEWRNYYCLAGRATAIDIDAVIGFSFTNCLFSDIVSDRSFAEGLHLSGTIDRFGCPRFDIGENAFFKVKDCTFRNIICNGVTSQQTLGIFSWGDCIDIENTTIDTVRSTSGPVVGIILIGAAAPPATNLTNARVINTRITNMSSGATGAFVTGIKLERDTDSTALLAKNILVDNAWISGISGANDAIVNGILVVNTSGARTNPISNVVIRNTIVVDVKASSPSVLLPISAGIGLINAKNPVVQNSTVLDCVAGILLANVADGVVKDNEVENCAGAGYADANVNASSTAFLNNRAYNNGLNYAVTYPGGFTPSILSGTFAVPPSSVTFLPTANISLTKV